MFSTKSIYQDICNSGVGRELSEKELLSLQNHLIKMYRDVEKVCSKHNIEICLAYGNVIGALRHNGWIPWDDDLDIHMTREDYDKFLSEYSKELPSQYKVSSYLSDGGSEARFAKIIDTSTVFVGLTSEKTSDSGCFIDIFPIDNLYNRPMVNKLKRIWCLFLMYTAGSVMQVEKHSIKYKNLMFRSKQGRNNWRIRNIWGRCFSFIRYKTWNKYIEKMGKNKGDTDYFHIVAARKYCYKLLKKDLILPFRSIELPDIGKINIPNQPEAYLEEFYGDWRTIPKDTDKWHHYVSAFYINDAY